MNCVSELDLMRYCDGALEEGERERVALHLASCLACARMVSNIEAENATLRAVLLAPWPMTSVSAATVVRQLGVTVVALVALRWIAVGFDDPSVFSAVPMVIGAVVATLRFLSYPVALILSLALLATIARIAVRRRVFALSAALFVVLMQAQSAAMIRRTGPEAVVAADEVVDDSVFAAGTVVRIDGRVNGDVVAMGNSVEVAGTIAGRLIATAQSVTISGSVTSVQAFGRTLEVRGEVGQWRVWGQDVHLAAGARILQSAVTMGDVVTLEGTVAGPLSAFGNKLTIGSRARMDHLRARVNRASIESGALIREGDVRSGTAARLAPESLAGRAVVLVLAFALGWRLWIRRRTWLFVSAERIALWWGNLLRGAAALLCTLFISVALVVTIIGVPVAVLLLGVVAFGCITALAVSATFIAEHLLPRSRVVRFPLRLLIALLLLGVASLPGYGIGSAISVIAVFAGLGAMAGTYLSQGQTAAR